MHLKQKKMFFEFSPYFAVFLHKFFFVNQKNFANSFVENLILIKQNKPEKSLNKQCLKM